MNKRTLTGMVGMCQKVLKDEPDCVNNLSRIPESVLKRSSHQYTALVSVLPTITRVRHTNE